MQTERYTPWEILRGRTDGNLARWDNPRPPLAGYSLFVIQHVLDDLPELISAFIRLGCAPEDISIVGIPYSSRDIVGNDIRATLGCQVDLPRVFPFDASIYVRFLEIYEQSVKKGNRIIILEDGGYTVPIVSQLAIMGRINGNITVGAVEQTSRGMWVDQQMEFNRYLRIPVIAIPTCLTKTTAEPPYIAYSVQDNLRRLLDEIHAAEQLEIKQVGVFGYGTIGAKVAEYFTRSWGATIYVSENDPDRLREAASVGYPELTSERLRQCDLVIGTTGATSISLRILSELKDGAIIASTSSRQVEIDIRALYGRTEQVAEVGDIQAPVIQVPAGRRFDCSLGGRSKSLFVLYDGYPINFSGQSLPNHVGDAVLSLLLEGVVAISQGELQSARMYYAGANVIKSQDEEIYDYWCAIKPDDGLHSCGNE